MVSDPGSVWRRNWVFELGTRRPDFLSNQLELALMFCSSASVLLAIFWWMNSAVELSSVQQSLIAGSASLCVLLVFWVWRTVATRCPSDAVHLTHIGACMMQNGQATVQATSLRMHPLGLVLQLRIHHPTFDRRGFRLFLWRHQFHFDQYRRLTLVLRWLASQRDRYE